jgi:5-methylcytosine-specific restriction enzyme B
MAQLTNSAAQLVYPAARRVVTRVLRESTSLFSGRRPLWRDPVLGRSRERLTHATTHGTGTFEQRLGTALGDADDDVAQLVAEALYIHLLVADDVLPETKRRLLAIPLERMDRPLRVPTDLDGALAGGLTTTTGAFTRRRLSQLTFLVTSALAWRATRVQERRAALTSPWAFRSWLWTVEVDGAQAQREALLHLVHPDAFEATASRRTKVRIVEAFGTTVVDGDVDRALLTLRSELAAAHGHGFAFTEPALAGCWRGGSPVS